jgi:hypothetical protein
MKIDTMYSENERELTLKQLDNWGLNPFSFWGMIESYIQHIHPLPVRWTYEYFTKDDIMDPRAESKKLVELDIRAVGNLSSKFWGNPLKLDQTFTRLFCQSYYENLRPLPISFQIMDAIEIHLRTPGVTDSERKNPLRNHWQFQAK